MYDDYGPYMLFLRFVRDILDSIWKFATEQTNLFLVVIIFALYGIASCINHLLLQKKMSINLLYMLMATALVFILANASSLFQHITRVTYYIEFFSILFADFFCGALFQPEFIMKVSNRLTEVVVGILVNIMVLVILSSPHIRVAVFSQAASLTDLYLLNALWDELIANQSEFIWPLLFLFVLSCFLLVFAKADIVTKFAMVVIMVITTINIYAALRIFAYQSFDAQQSISLSVLSTFGIQLIFNQSIKTPDSPTLFLGLLALGFAAYILVDSRFQDNKFVLLVIVKFIVAAFGMSLNVKTTKQTH